ncbi:DUF6580 family putative transport protein [Mucilaginibacter polytrichastri]|uniref:Uncharacterized protein n=1 Tax=Mucilaginibacter polytrichastri TaxID=1302689 RepID=A0A1Q5ZWS3_9SPHI|nr:DUF6580 family putative transport protein [Mucilaginibacter polytrichastri]OKS86183.1 hypothetical protein RG47T_1634 [Mucilaginibacter polytrichastri]SFT15715.1 hypothetical protein SAMN04487890_11345 [Mucilaginibacter polytrichastri]
MSQQQKINIRNAVLILMIIAAAAMRLVSYKYQFLSNFTPVGAIAIFGGAYFNDKWKAYLVPFAALFVSDLVINYLYFSKLVWYTSSLWMYASFFAMVFFGSLIKKVNFSNVILASLGGVIIHWLLTDIEPWLNGTLYSKGIMGYFESLAAAIPFEKNMILGDLVFGLILFGGFEFAKSKYAVLRAQPTLAAA